MRGYLILSSEEWCEDLKKQETDKAVFWRKRKTFKAVNPGEYIYFMSRKKADQSRCIVGRGLLKDSTSMSAAEAWNKYGRQLGSLERDDFINIVHRIYGTSELTIGCLVLDNVEFLDNPITIHSFGIVYQNGTVSGKTLTEEECDRINNSFKEGKKNG